MGDAGIAFYQRDRKLVCVHLAKAKASDGKIVMVLWLTPTVEFFPSIFRCFVDGRAEERFETAQCKREEPQCLARTKPHFAAALAFCISPSPASEAPGGGKLEAPVPDVFPAKTSTSNVFPAKTSGLNPR
jgi:hypothetical protein